MGACDYIRLIRGDRAAVEKQWASIVEEDRHESGSGGYAGNATTMRGSISFHDEKLANEEEARRYILDRHEKWTGPLACCSGMSKYFATLGVSATAAIKASVSRLG